MFKVKEISKMTLFVQMSKDALLGAAFPDHHKATSDMDVACIEGGKVAQMQDGMVSVIEGGFDSLVDKIEVADDTGVEVGLRISKSNWKRWKMSQV